jgi:hypothetical protein
MPYAASPDNGLTREVKATSEKRPQNLWLRIGKGTSVKEENGEWNVDGVRFRIEGAEVSVRTISGRQELLVPMTFGQDGSAKVRITMIW